MGEAKRRKTIGGGDGEWTGNDIQNILMDPRVTGVGGFPRVIDDAQWIEANVKLIKEMGAGCYLQCLLSLLHSTMGELPPEQNNG